MKTARGLIVWILLPVAIAGALVVSASATITLLTSQGVAPAVAPFGVLMLEVASLAGTLLWVLVGNRSLRRDAVLTTMAATAVAVVAGVVAYGPVGAVGGIMLVAVVHLASRAWRETWAAAPALADGQLDTEVATDGQEGPHTVADLVLQQSATVGEELPAEPEPTPEPESAADEATTPSAEVVAISRSARRPPPPKTWKRSASVWRAAIDDARTGTGRPTLIKTYRLTSQEARHVLDAVKREKAA